MQVVFDDPRVNLILQRNCLNYPGDVRAALERAGGPVLQNYRRLVAAADASQMGSPAQQELAAFFQEWQRDPAG